MAFATASNVTCATALFTTALAIPILGKRVGLIRRIAVLVGFLEIIMVIQLGTEVFSAYAFFPFATAAPRSAPNVDRSHLRSRGLSGASFGSSGTECGHREGWVAS